MSHKYIMATLPYFLLLNAVKKNIFFVYKIYKLVIVYSVIT